MNEVDGETLQKRHHLKSDIAAMDGDVDAMLPKDVDCTLHGSHIPMTVAQHADFHRIAPEAEIQVANLAGKPTECYIRGTIRE